MSKIGWTIAVVGGASLLTYVAIKQKGGTASELALAGLLPAETVAFIELPDLKQSAVRFKETGLWKLANEPEISAFLEKPLSQIPALPQTDSQEWKQVDPQQFFVALTHFSTQDPRLVVGLKYGGERAHLDAWVKTLRDKAKEQKPTGKSDLIRHHDDEIETFAVDEMTLAGVAVGKWYFVSNHSETLQILLDRYHRRQVTGEALANDDRFKKSVAPLRRFDTGDMRAYANLQPVWTFLADLRTIQGQAMSEEEKRAMQAMESAGIVWSFDGELIREDIFSYGPQAPKVEPLSADSFRLTTENSIFVYHGKMVTENFHVNQFKPLEGFLGSEALVDLFQKGMGDTISMVIDWPQDAPQSSFWLGGTIKDAAVFREKLPEALPMLQSSEKDGMPLWTFSQAGLPLAVTLGLTKDHWLFAVQQPAFDTVVARSANGGKTLLDSPGFEEAAKTLSVKVGDSAAVVYFDLPGVLRRTYDQVRPMLPMLVALSPQASKVIDPAKLPSTEALVKHLKPLVLLGTSTANGYYLEQSGTVTVYQAAIPVVIAALVAQEFTKPAAPSEE